MATPANFHYPILAITHQGFVYAVADEVTLRTARARALRMGHFEGLSLVDAEGVRYRVDRIQGARVAPGEWLGKLLGTIANPRMRVELEIRREGVLTLEEVKSEVRAGVRKLAHVHDEAVGGVESILSQVERAGSMPQLIECFFGYV